MDDLNSLGDYFENAIRQMIDWIPDIVAFVIILVVGYFVAKVLQNVVQKGLQKTGLDRRLHESQGGNFIERAIPSPSRLAGRIAFWSVVLGALSLAVAGLGIPVLADMLRAVYAYIPNVVAAVIIFIVAGAVSAAVVNLIRDTMGDTPTGRIIGTMAPMIVMGIGVFMILNQLRIAPEIVTITYAALIGSAALGSALAFGLGGRDVAARMLEGAYTKAKENKGQVRRDVKRGVERGRGRLANR